MAPTDNLPDVSVKVVIFMALPMVAVPPPFMMKVAILFVVPGVPWLKNKLPIVPVPPSVKLELALPVKNCVADMPLMVPFIVSVKAPMVTVLAVPTNDTFPLTIALPVNENTLADPAANSRLPSVAPDILLLVPVMLILPLPVLVCMPVPAMFPAQVIVLPPSASVPVSVNVVPMLRLLPKVVVPALAVRVAKLLVVPGVVGSK